MPGKWSGRADRPRTLSEVRDDHVDLRSRLRLGKSLTLDERKMLSRRIRNGDRGDAFPLQGSGGSIQLFAVRLDDQWLKVRAHKETGKLVTVCGEISAEDAQNERAWSLLEISFAKAS